MSLSFSQIIFQLRVSSLHFITGHLQCLSDMKGFFSYSFSIQPWALGPQDLCPGKWGQCQQKLRPFSVKVEVPKGTLQPDCEQRCILATQGAGPNLLQRHWKEGGN